MAVETEILIERAWRPIDGMKISWGGVLAGSGALMLLSSLGLAIEISATDPVDPNGSSLGTRAAVWTGLALLISLFVAAWASTRLSMLWERTTALFEGVLVWVLSLILIMYLTASGISLLASGAFGLPVSSAQAVAATASSMDVDFFASGSVDEILARLHDPQTVSIVASGTGMSRTEATNTLRDISARVEAAGSNPAEAVAEARRGIETLVIQAQQNLASTAAEVKPEVTATAWFNFAALVLSLIAAIGGSASVR